MGAYRCSLCGVCWPPDGSYRTCPQCGSTTWYSHSEQADPVERAAAAGTAPAAPPAPASAVAAPVTDEAHEWRVARYVELGFDEPNARLLATARDGLWPLNWQRVQRALAAGCTHAEALAIFA